MRGGEQAQAALSASGVVAPVLFAAYIPAAFQAEVFAVPGSTSAANLR